MSDLCVILCTCPDKSSARAIACKAVEERLAACVNIVSSVESVYRWEDRIQQDSECQLVLKTATAKVSALQSLVLAMHPYDVPEWLVLDVASASDEYQKWIINSVQ